MTADRHAAWRDARPGAVSPSREKRARSALSAERWLLRRLLRAAGRPRVRFVLWDGTSIAEGAGREVATVAVRDRPALWRLLSDPSLHFGEMYSAGRLEVEGDLVGLLEEINRAPAAPQWAWLSALLHKRRRANSLAGSRRNIHHHYDLGNDFYRLWLDDELLYTCAYYPSPAASLEEAQRAKMELVCRKLQLQPGERVIEAGSGWGGLALYMARQHGVTVRSYNISRQQVEYGRRRLAAEGLADRVELVEDDYRAIDGTCDAFVSVGMLEHVGRRHYKELGAVIDRVLGRDGRALVHTIGRSRQQPLNPWIERRIFPGAYPPTLSEMSAIFEPWDFAVLDVENLRLHYAQTLRHWLERFEASEPAVRDMFDDTFVRTWRLYLSGSIAAFTKGSLQLYQVLVSRASSSNVPLSRSHLYDDAPLPAWTSAKS